VSSSPVLAAVAAPLLAGRGGDTAVEEAANGGSRRTGAGGQATGNEGTEIVEGRTIHGSTGGGQARPVAQSDTWGLDQAGGGSESDPPDLSGVASIGRHRRRYGGGRDWQPAE